MLFCFSGDDDKQKLVSIADNNRSKITRIRLNHGHTQIYADEKWQRAERLEK